MSNPKVNILIKTKTIWNAHACTYSHVERTVNDLSWVGLNKSTPAQMSSQWKVHAAFKVAFIFLSAA